MIGDIKDLARDTLTRIDAAEAVRGDRPVDWAALGARMNQPRRRSFAGARGLVLGAAVAVVLIVVAVLVAVPHLRPGPADEAARPDRTTKAGETPVDDRGHWHSALYGQPVKGSLASDSAFVDGVVAYLESPAASADPQLKEFTPVPGTIRVEYAGDVGDHRAVLVEGEWNTPSAGEAPQQIQFWLDGEAGAAPAQLTGTQERSWPPVDDQLLRFGGSWELGAAGLPPAWNQLNHEPGGFILVSPRDHDVRLVDRPIALDAKGGVHVPGSVVPMTGGVATGIVQDSRDHGTTLYVRGAARGYTQQEQQEPPELAASPAQRTPLRGGDAWPGSTISADVRAHELTHLGWMLADAVMQPRDQGTFQVLAEASPAGGSGEGRTTGETGRVVVGMITYPNGPRVLAAQEVSPQPDGVNFNATDVLGAKLTPGGGDPDDLAIAWTKPDGFQPGWSGAMGPAGTATVEWVHRDGRISSSPAVNTIATTSSDGITQARFLDASGAELGTAAVSPALVEVGSGQVVPPVARALGGSD